MNQYNVIKTGDNEFSVTEQGEEIGYIDTSEDDRCLISIIAIPTETMENVLPIMEKLLINEGCKKSKILVDIEFKNKKPLLRKLGYTIHPYGSSSDIAEKKL